MWGERNNKGVSRGRISICQLLSLCLIKYTYLQRQEHTLEKKKECSGMGHVCSASLQVVKWIAADLARTFVCYSYSYYYGVATIVKYVRLLW